LVSSEKKMARQVDPMKEIKSSRGTELLGKRIVLCVTGSVAAIDAPSLARELMRRGAEVHAFMTEAAKRLVRPDLLEWATGNPVTESLTGKTEHVRLVNGASLVVVAPCTANTISKVALGIDDTPVTTVCSMALGSGIPIVLCPAAHEPMYRNPAVVQNLARLGDLGVEVVEPRIEEGKAKIADNETIVATVRRRLSKRDMEGVRILVTGGPTVEFIDPVRVITNLSSGKMGLGLALEAWTRGARTKYLFGGSSTPPAFLDQEKFQTTEDMLRLVVKELGDEEKKYDVYISAAAPADFAPTGMNPTKIPTTRGEFTLNLRPTAKVIDEVRRRAPGIFILAFKAETVGSTEELEERARAYLRESGVEMVAANPITKEVGFGSDRNEVIIVTRDRTLNLGRDLKERLARRILDEVSRDLQRRGGRGTRGRRRRR
jgi:phosphopantothenoylcysteine decarboxylase/phosphopantothenate--cysteine ligase